MLLYRSHLEDMLLECLVRSDYNSDCLPAGSTSTPIVYIALLVWLANPLTCTISTRGNGDSIVVLGLVLLLRQLRLRRYLLAGCLYGALVHWRLFPVIYGPGLLLHLLLRPSETLANDDVALYKQAT